MVGKGNLAVFESVVYAMCFHACAEEGHMFFSLSLSDFSISLCPHLNPFLFWAIGRRIQFIKSIILNIGDLDVFSHFNVALYLSCS